MATIDSSITSALTTAATQALQASLQTIVNGAAADLQTFAFAIASSAVTAVAANDTATLSQLQDQASTLLEINRLRVADEALPTFNAVLSAVLNVLTNFAASYVAAAI